MTKRLSRRNNICYWMMILSLTGQGFQCEGYVHSPEIYIGGIVRDYETREPIPGIEICIYKGLQFVKTDEEGKFGFKEGVRDKYLLQFRDKREDEKEKNVGIDTILRSENEKILADILLRRK